MGMFFLLAILSGGMIAAAGTQTAHDHSASRPFSISIRAVNSEVPVGSPIQLMVRLTNTSDHEMGGSGTYDMGMDYSYEYDIRTARGVKLQQKRQPRQPGVPIIDSATIRNLKPGESFEDPTQISDQFDLSKPGKYVIQLSRYISGNPHDGVVKSNKITVTLTSRPGAASH